MIKSLEKFKEFNDVSQSLNKKFSKVKMFFDEDFSIQLKTLFENFDNFSLNELENRLECIKIYRKNIEKIECNQKTKDKLFSVMDECLFFINDLIMNQIIENI